MKEDNILALSEAIAHWKRMIEWAKKQPESSNVNENKMLTEIKENWHGCDCPLCQVYCIGPFIGCHKSCPVQEKYGMCDGPNKNGWRAVNLSETWGEWVDNANIFLKQLERLLETKEQA